MMHFKFSINVPANTPSSAPVTQEIKLTKGTIIQVGYWFIPDCAGYVGTRVKLAEHVVWPTNPGEWYIRNEGGEVFPENYDLTQLPYKLTIEAYNEDDSYDHDVEWSFTVQPAELTLTGIFKRLFTPSQRVSVEL
jgi:hypothetical protein